MRPVIAVLLVGTPAAAEVAIKPGLALEASYAGEVFVAPALDDDRYAVAGLATLALVLAEDDRLGAARIVGFAIHGEGLSPQLGDVLGVSNNVAEEDVRLFEAWVEQSLGPLTLRAGLLAVDQEFIIAGASTALLGATFGMIAMIAYNIVTPVYAVAPDAPMPVYVDAGVRIRAFSTGIAFARTDVGAQTLVVDVSSGRDAQGDDPTERAARVHERRHAPGVRAARDRIAVKCRNEKDAPEWARLHRTVT